MIHVQEEKMTAMAKMINKILVEVAWVAKVFLVEVILVPKD